jgi:glucose/arabinose dehydrogenase
MKNSIFSKKILLVGIILIFQAATQLFSQTFPAGFSQTMVVNGISSPTTMAFAPDGRIFICEQTGALKIVKAGVLIPTAAITIAVNSSGERGLLGIAFDPNFNANQFIYLYYTTNSPAIHNQISKYKMTGDIATFDSDIFILDNLGPTNHNGGYICFGPDGKLYVAVGDNATGSNAQSNSNYLGKILRLNSDGSIPSDNPKANSLIIQERAFWATGLRNPQLIAFQPNTGKIFVNDVGQGAWEEINENTTAGLNFGWPSTEGFFNAASFPNFTNPVYAYGHAGNTVGQGCAITGGTFFSPALTNYGSEYKGNYFFLDFCGNWIDRLVLSTPVLTNKNKSGKVNADIWTRSNFASNISGSAVGLTTGPDGNLYYLSRNTGELIKIVSDAVLPLKLISFNVLLLSNKSAELNWVTSSETNTLKFEIQKSEDSKYWENIGEINASRNSNENINYQFIDNEIKEGQNYYRLKQIDLDGKFDFSPIRQILIENTKVVLYPNPAESFIFYSSKQEDFENTNLYNLTGQKMTHLMKKATNGLDISLLPKGKYFLVSPTIKKTFIKN